MRSLVSVLVVLIAVASAVGGCAPLRRFEFTRLCMGVRADVVLYARDADRAALAAQAAFERLAELDAVLSDYRRDSELARVNAAAGGDPVPVGPDLRRVLEAAARVSAASEGAFDATAGTASRLWRRMRDERRLADPSEIARVRSLIDWRAVEISAAGVRLARPGMSLDLGGIAKGYAAQEAARVLADLGHPRCLVALGGDISAGAPPPGEHGWSIRVADGSVCRVARSAASTSGDAEQFVEIDGVRYAHIVDPRTGVGAARRAAVTAFAVDGATADAVATAAYLLGPERSIPFLADAGALAVWGPEPDPRSAAVGLHARPATR